MNSPASKRIMDLLDAYQSDAEFLRMIQRNRTLHLCKTIGFPHLKKAGVFEKQKLPKKVKEAAKKKKKYWVDMKALAVDANNLLLQGITCTQAARQLNTTEYTMRRALKMAGIKQWPNKKQMFQIEEVLELAKQGYTTQQLGQKFNCTRQAISEKLRKNGYKYDKQRKEYIKC